MRLFPFNKTVVLQTAIVVLVPILPLTLTMISLEEQVKRLLGIWYYDHAKKIVPHNLKLELNTMLENIVGKGIGRRQ